MHSQRLLHTPEPTYLLYFESGEEVVSLLQRFVREHSLGTGHFNATGAFSSATLGYFDHEQKAYEKIIINEQVEVLSLHGNVSFEQGEPSIHARAVFGKRDGTAHGGHLLQAYVRPALKMVLTVPSDPKDELSQHDIDDPLT